MDWVKGKDDFFLSFSEFCVSLEVSDTSFRRNLERVSDPTHSPEPCVQSLVVLWSYKALDPQLPYPSFNRFGALWFLSRSFLDRSSFAI